MCEAHGGGGSKSRKVKTKSGLSSGSTWDRRWTELRGRPGHDPRRDLAEI